MAMEDAVVAEQDLFQQGPGAWAQRWEFAGILECLPAVGLRVTLRWRGNP